MNGKVEASTNCPYCIGYTDASGFHHGINCPTLANNISNMSVTFTSTKEDKIVTLLESIDFKLHRIQEELETIRMRTK